MVVGSVAESRMMNEGTGVFVNQLLTTSRHWLPMTRVLRCVTRVPWRGEEGVVRSGVVLGQP